MKRCRFCRKAGGELILQPASDDYRPGRSWYKAIGFAASYYHAACLAEFEAFEVKSRARADAEFEARVTEIRQQIKEAK